MSTLSIAALGTLETAVDGQPLTGLDSAKVRALLVYLALESDRPHGRAALATLLWPHGTSRSAKNSLRNALANLHRALGDVAEDEPFIEADGRRTLRFNPRSEHAMDVHRFRELVASAQAHRHRRAEGCPQCRRWLTEAASIYRGDFLEGFALTGSPGYDDWILLTREALRDQLRGVLARLCAIHECMGLTSESAALLRRRLALTPWDERGHRQAMRMYARSGDRSLAIAQFRACREHLAQEFDLEPERKTKALAAVLREGGITGDLENAGNLPGARASFVGRVADQLHLVGRLSDPNCRAMALTGPGGIGKSHLARVVAREVAPQFEDGVWWVRLAEKQDRRELVDAFWQALSGRAGAPPPRDRSPLAVLRPMRALVVLDDCEHLSHEVARLESAILRSCPGICVLTTNRIWAPVHGKEHWRLEPLGHRHVPRGGGSLTGIDAPSRPTESAQLFLLRAQQALGRFDPDEGDRQRIERICYRLGGLPLAIEMAASLCRQRGLRGIKRLIESDLGNLSHAAHVGLTHHRSLRACFQWSEELLEPPDHALLQRLAELHGPWHVRQRSVGGGQQAIVPGHWQSLHRLVDASIVRCHLDGREPRYEIPPTIRQVIRRQRSPRRQPRIVMAPAGFVPVGGA